MVTLYTAVGQFELKETAHGERMPTVTTHAGEHFLDIPEMIIWSSLMWNFMTIEELRPIFYRKEKEAHILGEMSCEEYVERLETRDLLVSGSNYSGADALFKLLSNLHIYPVTASFTTKLITFFKLTCVNRIPLKSALEIFNSDEFTHDEKIVMQLVNQKRLTTAELIMCIDKGVTKQSSHEQLLETLYSDDKTTCYNIAIPARFSEKRQSVIQTVASLYLRKQLVFEKLL